MTTNPVSSRKIFRINFILAVMFTSCYSVPLSPTSSPVTSIPTKQNATATPITGPEAYIGLTYPPFPNSISFSTSSSMIIFPSKSHDSWAVEIVADKHQDMLWLSKFISRDSNGKPTFQVSDTAALPPQEEDFGILVNQCLLSGSLDPEIVALARINEDNKIMRYLFNQSIVLAWRANRSNGKIEKINTKNIECYCETILDYP